MKNLIWICVFLFIGCQDTTGKRVDSIKEEITIDIPIIDKADENNLLVEKHLITAPNGLFVRSSPGFNGVKLNKLPYKTKVKVIKKTEISDTLNNNGFNIIDKWMEIENDTVSDKSYVFGGYLKTISQIEKICERPMYVYKENTWDDFYGVYQFSNSIIGIALLQSDEENAEQRLDFNKIDENYVYELIDSNNKHSLYKDTFVNLFKNKSVTSKYNSLIGSSFYIYCSKKVVKVKIEDVLFHYNECSTPFVMLKFNEKIFNTSTGIPLFASKRKLENVEFNSFNKEMAHFNYRTDICNLWVDCLFQNDNGHINLSFKYQDYYFGYRNDANYNDENFIEPYRYIISIKEDNINYHLSSHLGLLGCPCM